MSADTFLVALAGQPNCGKSTVFNALTGASQHVANYPGVTVDKMTGWYRHNGYRVEVVDLPGTYSLTSFSPEERVSRDFILHEKPLVTVNVMDAANLKRCLYLTFQLLEMEIPVVLNLNMMDVVENQGIDIDMEKLSQQLGIPVVPTAMKSGRGKKELRHVIDTMAATRPAVPPLRIDYGEMEPFIREIVDRVASETNLAGSYALRWLAIKLMEGDSEVRRLIQERNPDADPFIAMVDQSRTAFEDRFEEAPEVHIANCRYKAAGEIARACLTRPQGASRPLSDKIDAVVCHRLLGPVILIGVIWLLYYLAIVQGYTITNYTWPLLAKLRSLTEAVMPSPGFIDIPLIREFSLWIVDSVNALLNYIPIFFILFALIAILEDSGYMPRMAFIMDRLFSRYGLHGQSTLPMVLGGIYVGGCAVPGVMSCKGIPDERSRMATILIIPLLNCLAKVPLYVLLINIYFAAHKAWAMFFISTISFLMVLSVSKILTLTVLKDRETAPFVMEMPPYHLPTWRGVLGRAVERVWLFVRKISTIVVAVAVVIFVLLQFPGIGKERMDDYRDRKEKAVAAFYKKIDGTPFHDGLQGERLMELVLYQEAYKNAKMKVRGEDAVAALNADFKARDALFFKIVQPGKDKTAKKAGREFKKLVKARKGLLREMRKERIDQSFLGTAGRWLEPVTRWAGFNWRVNVALLSALAAKESSVATLGALYEQEEEGEALENRMARGEVGFTALHALALMLFMVLYPPCMATSIAVKIQAGSVKWMLFSIGYPMLLGLVVATLVFSLGSVLGLSGLQAMIAFYCLALIITVGMGFFKNDGQSSKIGANP
ncbi:ferrous iron transport protein B [Desulfosarcina ovata subsp. sediminis]|uniref:Ferrous iron transport protein B n=1 Tax=Desulfosarcina ovata subsp. sediminis TaxID=885957 RepID=A0A5K7ZUX8_9BACT|nr:ferrous iron transport protein B [Desulfosarcina ovata]BBO84047.1 ferrous iron transport protein B [Desulfosarcina ovata subsp. sediminis]